jgi:hypothetical protein
MGKITLVFDLSDDQILTLRESLSPSIQVSNDGVMDKDEFVDTDEVMSKFKVSRSVINVWKKNGLPYLKTRPNKFKLGDVLNYINRKTIRRK